MSLTSYHAWIRKPVTPFRPPPPRRSDRESKFNRGQVGTCSSERPSTTDCDSSYSVALRTGSRRVPFTFMCARVSVQLPRTTALLLRRALTGGQRVPDLSGDEATELAGVTKEQGWTWSS